MKPALFALAAGLAVGVAGSAGAQTGGTQQPGAAVANEALPSGFQTSPLLRSGTTADGMPIIYPRTETPEIIAVIGSLEPGGRTSRHQHPMPVFVHVLDGTLEAQTDGRPMRTYAAGQSFIESRNHWHQAFNRQATPARILVVFMGEQGKPTTINAR